MSSKVCVGSTGVNWCSETKRMVNSVVYVS